MKITKSQLKKLLIEEIENNQELINSINALAGSIEDLDVSIDYLTSAVTGDDPYTTNMLQKGFGRLAKPSKKSELEEGDIEEILSSAADVGDYVADFRKSDAPQFKGKSKKKRTQMAIAAALDAEDEEEKKKRGKK